MTERRIEQALVKAVKSQGGMCLKLNSASMRGLPDRLVLLPHGRIAFVELKAPKGKVRPQQSKRHEQLQKLGFITWVINDQKGVEDFEIHTARIPETRNQIRR